MARVLVPLAEGFEEIEAVTVIDLLRRAGIEVCTAKVGSEPNHPTNVPAAAWWSDRTASRSQADALLADVDDAGYDMIVLPGGMPGAAHLKGDARVIELLRRMQLA